MSWYQDPHLFICNAYNTASHGFNVYRCTKGLSGSIHVSNLQRLGNGLSKCLSLGNYRESDFDALLAYLIDTFITSGLSTWRIVNCQGLTIVWESTCGGVNCSWSREPVYSPYYSLPGIFTPPVDAEKEALRRRVSDLQAEISPLRAEVQRNTGDKNTLINEKKALEKTNSQLKERNSTLEADVQRETKEKKDLGKQVSDLTSKLKECCGDGGGSADGGTWKSGNSTVPSNGVSFDDLDVQNFIPMKSLLKIIRAPGALKFVEDNTTNVGASRFYGGVHLVVVNVDELIPDKDEARFDPDIWGSYKKEGKSYATRKLYKSEI